MNFNRMEFPRIDIRSAQRQVQMTETIEAVKYVVLSIANIALRLPGIFLLELWWRNRDVTFEDIRTEMVSKAPLNSYFDISTILDFVHRRDLDHSAALILGNIVLVLSALFITLPLNRLVRLYAHMLSLSIFAVAHYLSITYVTLEQSSEEFVLKLDDFVKLERHGFHFLSQLTLALLQSFILKLDSQVGRVFLTMFTAPIVARMCACPPEHLIIAHNVASASTMMLIGIYLMSCAPIMWLCFTESLTVMKNIFVARGLPLGAIAVWRKLLLTEQLAWAWVTMFGLRVYVELYEKGRSFWEAGPVLLSGVAESTNTPLSLLSLALTVGCICKFIVEGTNQIIGNERRRDDGMNHSGYTEALTLVLLCTQASLLGMKTESKIFLMSLALFLVVSALMQSLYELLEPQLLSLAASPVSTRGKHIRCLLVAGVVYLSCWALVLAIVRCLPLDLWCVLICSNVVLVIVHLMSAVVQYIIGIIESNAPEPWERSDNLLFNVKLGTKAVELLIAGLVLTYGVYFTIIGDWNMITIVVLVFHCYINVYRRVADLYGMIHSRLAADSNINRLAKADVAELKARSDPCTICFIEMTEEARVTPCRHFFHSACLRKWLAVKQVCPLCYQDMGEKDVLAKEATPPEPERGGAEWRELHRMDGARDMWPLLRERQYSSSSDSGSEGNAAESSDAHETGSTTGTEFTLASTESDREL